MRKQTITGIAAIMATAILGTGLHAQTAPATPDEKDNTREMREKRESMYERQKILEEKEKSLQEVLEKSAFVTADDFDFQIDFESLPGRGFYVINGQGSSSQLSLSKSYDGESKDTEGSFDVDNSTRGISISISGSAKSGSIKIELFSPDGEVQGNLTIDESADLRFTKRIKVGEESKEYYGEWEYKVSAKDARGYYKLSISTN